MKMKFDFTISINSNITLTLLRICTYFFNFIYALCIIYSLLCVYVKLILQVLDRLHKAYKINL